MNIVLQVSGHLPTHPRVTTQPLAMMDCDDPGGTCPIRVTQHEVQYMITTSHISRVS